MHDIVDLRSDTLTLPTPLMREAMARAEVGDDVWEEDPTVRRLEELAARRTGKEAALFVSSGTQGNLVSVLTETRPGQEIILDADCHIFNYEVAAAAMFGGVQTLPLKTPRGFLDPEQVRAETVRTGRVPTRPASSILDPTGQTSRGRPARSATPDCRRSPRRDRRDRRHSRGNRHAAAHRPCATADRRVSRVDRATAGLPVA